MSTQGYGYCTGFRRHPLSFECEVVSGGSLDLRLGNARRDVDVSAPFQPDTFCFFSTQANLSFGGETSVMVNT
jgi:hypothetical protein